VIRRARAGEADALTDLAVRSKAQWGYGEDFLAAASSELLVVEREGALVAFAALDFGADQPELDALFVDEEWIGSGLGGALLEAACTVARRRGVDALVIESDPNAEDFYRRHGAEPIGERRSESTGRMLPLLRIATGGSASGGA
jgi:N-acetylglutamate synthase-like GNAT family acetyltransferase